MKELNSHLIKIKNPNNGQFEEFSAVSNPMKPEIEGLLSIVDIADKNITLHTVNQKTELNPNHLMISAEGTGITTLRNSSLTFFNKNATGIYDINNLRISNSGRGIEANIDGIYIGYEVQGEKRTYIKDTLAHFAGTVLVKNNIILESTGDSFKTILDDIKNLKKSVSDGKIMLADAITEKGVETASDCTFAEMAENIKNIQTDVAGNYQTDWNFNIATDTTIFGIPVYTYA